MNPQDIEEMGKLIPNSYVKICENGSHCTMFDDQEVYFETLHRFFDAVETENKKNRRDFLYRAIS